jgi:hypothetical protein
MDEVIRALEPPRKTFRNAGARFPHEPERRSHPAHHFDVRETRIHQCLLGLCRIEELAMRVRFVEVLSAPPLPCALPEVETVERPPVHERRKHYAGRSKYPACFAQRQPDIVGMQVSQDLDQENRVERVVIKWQRRGNAVGNSRIRQVASCCLPHRWGRLNAACLQPEARCAAQVLARPAAHIENTPSRWQGLKYVIHKTVDLGATIGK